MSTPKRRSLRETIALARAAERPAINGNGSAPASQAAPGGRTRRAEGASPPAIPPGELTRRRGAVAEQYAEAQWDLGGLVYEMAIRDHFRLDVVQRQAAVLQEIDTELSALERLEKLESEGAAGTCTECAAPYARGASFCWRCGHTLDSTMVVS